MTVDKPVVQISLANLRKEIVTPEVLRMSLSGSKVITWPDLYATESVEAEEVFAGLNRSATNWAVLAKWLSEKDCAALKAEKLSLRELGTVVNSAVSYYEGTYGKPGEGNASAS